MWNDGGSFCEVCVMIEDLPVRSVDCIADLTVMIVECWRIIL